MYILHTHARTIKYSHGLCLWFLGKAQGGEERIRELHQLLAESPGRSRWWRHLEAPVRVFISTISIISIITISISISIIIVLVLESVFEIC